jgi:hypothetical protein
VQAKSILFSVGQGPVELMVAKSFRRGSPFGLTLYCVAVVNGGRSFAKFLGLKISSSLLRRGLR